MTKKKTDLKVPEDKGHDRVGGHHHEDNRVEEIELKKPKHKKKRDRDLHKKHKKDKHHKKKKEKGSEKEHNIDED